MGITLDVETTTFEKGNPFSRRNKLCSVGIRFDNGVYLDFDIEHSDSPYGAHLERIRSYVEEADLLVGFAVKFDLHWLRRYINGIRFGRVWDCQLAEFILSGQKLLLSENKLELACVRYGLPPKLDVVRTEYWERGLDTTDVPWDILAEYQKRDIEVTKQLMEIQKERLKKHGLSLYRTFLLQCEDLLVLQEAEGHGMRLDVAAAERLAQQCEKELEDVEQQLTRWVGRSGLNWGSSDHVSAILYGGSIPFRVRVRTERVLKDGSIKVGEKWGEERIEFPRLVTPLERSENAATAGLSDDELAVRNAEQAGLGRRIIQRTYSTDEPTLRSLNCNKKVKAIIDLLLRRAELNKLVSVYYRGLPEIIKEKDWNDGELHGGFNQSIAATSRLTSSGPNLQNLAGVTKPLFVSRYDN